MHCSLNQRNGQLQLIDLDQPHLTPLIIDFASGKMAYRRKYGHAGGEAISKAVGIKRGYRPTIIDATAGLGRDAFVLATLGCRVHMIERSDVITKLLEDGLRRAKQDATIGMTVKENLTLTCGDSLQVLRQAPFVPDVIYLDPMFPQKEKSALGKKDMRLLQEIVGHDTDADTLLHLARTLATTRVVVKRPAHASFLAETTPHTSVKTKKHRFDIYLVKA